MGWKYIQVLLAFISLLWSSNLYSNNWCVRWYGVIYQIKGSWDNMFDCYVQLGFIHFPNVQIWRTEQVATELCDDDTMVFVVAIYIYIWNLNKVFVVGPDYRLIFTVPVKVTKPPRLHKKNSFWINVVDFFLTFWSI